MPAAASHVRKRREQRHMKLVGLGYRDYPHYLASASWAKVKRRYRDSDQPQDCMCGERESLHLHHMTYERIGSEGLTDLTPLCPTCHALIHELERRGEIGLDFTGLVNEQRAARNQEIEAARKERQGAEFVALHSEERVRAISRSLRERLKAAVILAASKGIDVSDELARVRDAIDALERRTKN